MPLQEVQKKTTSSEFTAWKVFFKKKRQRKRVEVTPQHFYLAQIAMEVRRVYYALLRKRMKETLEDFVLDFKAEKTKFVPYNQLSEEEKKIRLARSKAYWTAIANG